MSDLAATNRVRAALDQLQPALAPFVESNMASKHGTGWRKLASRAGGSDDGAALDSYGLLKTIVDNWRYTFDELFGPRERFKIRNFVSTALDARNATAHLTLPLGDEEALRYLDAIRELLKAVKAPEDRLQAVQTLYAEQRSHGLPAAAPPQGTLSLPAAASDEGRRLRPWIEVALPHPDVLANRFRQSEFAADLFAVDSGNAAAGDYTDPVQFFRITYLTEGLKRVLTSALERLAGQGGDPVIGLQTAFGGGKTHSMLAAWHLAQVDEPAMLDGVRELAERLGISGWRRPKVAAFVGTATGPNVSLLHKSGPDVRTLWGYLAWRLAGEAGLKLVAEAEASGTNPGSERFVDVLRLAGPSLILLDELVAYARQLPEERFEAFLSFIQSLTEAAKMVPDALVIGSLPESEAEAGGERGRAALLRLEKIFGRVQSPWLPASGDETYEIIRRRLFQPLDGEGEKARDETVKAFHTLYRSNAAEFPAHAKEARYQELLRLAYPIHPELFERLSKDWASLPNFQRTRGVLQFMANVIGVLWNERTSDPLITPGRVPVAHERVRASILYPLNPAFGAVVDREVDGAGSLPAQKEANPQRRISQARAATRAARAVFLCSAPLVGQANAGVTGPTIRLACVEPGDQLAIFGDALRELTEQAAFLYEEAGRYWFSTQPTLNRLADERAKALEDYRVDEAIMAMLQADARSKAAFSKVFAAPDEPPSIEEADALSLVVLKPAMSHSGRGASQSAATDAVREGLMRRGSGQRRNRNTLVFVAADDAALATAREVVRRAMAWQSIATDARLKAETVPAQFEDATKKARAQQDAAERAVRNSWNHVFLPVQASEPGQAFDLEHAHLTARERTSIAAVVYEKLKADALVSERLGAETFWSKIAPLWPDDSDHLALASLFEWFAAYPHLTKLRDRFVLEKAVADTVGKLDAPCAFASAYHPERGYSGLTYAKAAPAILPATAVLVRKATFDTLTAAATQLPHESKAPPIPTIVAQPGASVVDAHPVPDRPKRFFGSIDLDPLRPIKSLEAIIDAVVLQLQHSGGTKVTLTLDIQAESDRGFVEADIDVVRDNCRQLKFKNESTGFQ